MEDLDIDGRIILEWF